MALDDDRRANYELREKVKERIAEATREAAQEAAREAARHTARRAAFGYFALLFVLLVGAFFYQRSVDASIQTALDRSCARLNTLRVGETNPGIQTLWKAFYLARQRSQALAAHASDPKVRQSNQLATRQLSEFIHVLRWTPRTDCRAFAADPSGYRPPAPMPFTRRYLDLKVTPK